MCAYKAVIPSVRWIIRFVQLWKSHRREGPIEATEEHREAGVLGPFASRRLAEHAMANLAGREMIVDARLEPVTMGDEQLTTGQVVR